MTSRAFKCSISGISIDPEHALQFNGRVVSLELAKKWTSTFGLSCFPDGSVVPDCVHSILNANAEADPVYNNLIINQKFFLNKEFNDALTVGLLGHTENWPLLFSYLKVLMSWYIQVDPRKALEAFTSGLQLCATAIDMPSGPRPESITSLLNTCLHSYLIDRNVSDTIDAIDQQKINSRITFTGLDSALSRYISQFSSSENALMSYILESRS